MTEPVAVRLDPPGLEGLLRLPSRMSGLVVVPYARRRLDPQHDHLAEALGRAGYATFLLDLASAAANGNDGFAIEVMAEHIGFATDWALRQAPLRYLPVGYLGGNAGAAAALMAAAARPEVVRAVVARGGRPDLAAPVLGDVEAPTLLIVGSRDTVVLARNRAALAELACEKALQVVTGATHRFAEPGTLDQAVSLATDWFRRHLVPEFAALGEVGS